MGAVFGGWSILAGGGMGRVGGHAEGAGGAETRRVEVADARLVEGGGTGPTTHRSYPALRLYH